MTRINCSVNACSYCNGSICNSQLVTIGGASTSQVSGPNCGSFLNKSVYSNAAHYAPSGENGIEVTCVATDCTNNCDGSCKLDSISVGGNSQAQIYTQTECMLYKT